jgi:hypothetical protein
MARSRGVNRQGLSRHHMLFQSSPWESQPDLLALRSNPELIPAIPPDEHDAVHIYVSHVPVLSAALAASVRKNYRLLGRPDTYLHAAENFQRAVETSMNYRRFDSIERSVGELAIHAIDLQKDIVDLSNPITYQPQHDL